MATHLRPTTTINTLADICDAISSGLDGDPLTKALAPRWQALTVQADAYVASQRKIDRDLRRARIDIAVRDARWDPEAAALGRRTVDLSGGRRDQAPYTRFFSEYSPSAAQELRPEAEVKLGRRWIAELERDPAEPLAVEFKPRLELVTNALDEALEARLALEDAQVELDTSVALLLGEVNKELDILEGDLKKLFPGQPKRVASYLSATRQD
jgi:hypothetical protein